MVVAPEAIPALVSETDATPLLLVKAVAVDGLILARDVFATLKVTTAFLTIAPEASVNVADTLAGVLVVDVAETGSVRAITIPGAATLVPDEPPVDVFDAATPEPFEQPTIARATNTIR